MSPRAAAGAVVALALALAASRVLFPYDLGQYEGGLWAPAELLASGRNPYHVRLGLEPPYVMAPYGPVYYALVGVGSTLFGPQFWVGRLVSVLALLAAALGLARLARRGSGWSDAGWIAAGLFLASVPAQTWVATQRPDAVALALAVWALALAVDAHDGTEARGRPNGGAGAGRVLAAALLASLAALTRQTELAPLAVVPLWYGLRGAWRDAARFVAVAVVVLGAVTLVLESTSDGGYLWQQLVLPSGVARSGEQLGVVLGRLAVAPATWVASLACMAALPRMLAVLGRRDHGVAPSERIVVLAAAWLAAATAVALVTSARAGSNVNYWLEPAAAASLLGAFGIARLRAATPRAVRAVVVAVVLAAAVGAALLAPVERKRWRDRPLFDRAVARLAAMPSDAPYLTIYPELALRAGRTPWFNDPIQYDGRSRPHADVLTALRRAGAFPALVLNTPATFDAYREEPIDGDPPAADRPIHLFVRR